MNFLTKIFHSRIQKKSNVQAKQEKVLLIFPYLVWGGTATLYSEIISSLQLEGFHFSIITTREPPPYAGDKTEDFEKLGCSVYHLPLLGANDNEHKDIFWKLLDKGEFGNIILIGSAFAYEMLPEIKRRYPRCCIIDQLLNDGKHLRSNQSLDQFIDTTIVPSEILARKVSEGIITPHAKLSIVPHGIPIPSEADRRRHREAGEEMLPASARGKFLVSFFGRLSPEKCPETFLRIVECLRDMDGLFFLLVGDGPEHDKIFNLIEEKSLSEKIFSPGMLKKIDPLMAVSDVVIVPSSYDGQPLVVLEAQSYGKPVITTDVGSIPRMIKDSENGFLCKPTDINRFCKKLLLLYQDRELCKQLGENGFRSVNSNFTKEPMVEEYQRILSGG